MRPLADRCLLSFGSNAGPPMLPNYFYNNNYTIVQTPDHVMILTEMVHDARIIRLNAKTHIPARNQPWLGDSIGRWEGDTLVVETTNIHPMQREQTTPSCGRIAARARSSRSPSASRAPDRTRSSIASRWTIRTCSPRRSPASCRSRRSTR